MSTTALEVMMRDANFVARLPKLLEEFTIFRRSIFDEMLKLTGIKHRRIPRTDDMRQMLDDMGIEPIHCGISEIDFGRRERYAVFPLRRREYREPPADHVFDWTTVRIESRLQLRESDEILSTCRAR